MATTINTRCQLWVPTQELLSNMYTCCLILSRAVVKYVHLLFNFVTSCCQICTVKSGRRVPTVGSYSFTEANAMNEIDSFEIFIL